MTPIASKFQEFPEFQEISHAWSYKYLAGSTVFQYLISQTLSIHIILMCACMYFFSCVFH